MELIIKKSERRLVPEGVYLGQFIGHDTVQGPYSIGLRLKFQILNPEYSNKIVHALGWLSFDEEQKAYYIDADSDLARWARILAKAVKKPINNNLVDFNNFVGAIGKIIIKHVQADRVVYMNVLDILEASPEEISMYSQQQLQKQQIIQQTTNVSSTTRPDIITQPISKSKSLLEELQADKDFEEFFK